MSPNRESLIYPHLSNTIASIHFERNELNKAQAKQEEVLAIRRGLLHKDDLELATSYQNLGNLAGAQADQGKCIEYMTIAMNAWKKQPGKTALSLGIGELAIGRAQFNKSNYLSAETHFMAAELVFDREEGGNGFFTSG